VIKAVFGLPYKCGKDVTIFTPMKMIPFSYKLSILNEIERTLFDLKLWLALKTSGIKNVIYWLNTCANVKHIYNKIQKRVKLKIFDWSDDWESFKKYHVEEKQETKDKKDNCRCPLMAILDSDYIFTVSKTLFDRAVALNSNAYIIRNATDFSNFKRSQDNDLQKIKCLEDLKAPIIGYVGYILNRIDFDLVDLICQKNDTCQVVFVGPMMETLVLPGKIKNNARIHFLGAVDYQQLPHYIQYMDVLTIPHFIDEVTTTMDPIKIYDYMATGKPIVTTQVAGVNRFSELVHIAKDHDEFIRYLDTALSEDTPADIEKRMNAAYEHSWDSRAKEIIDILEG
jgi:glycosyltransferase involved in cell wall biosynthesis